MLFNRLTLQQVEMALEYLENPEELYPPTELQKLDLDELEWTAIKVLNQHLKIEREHSSLH
jgi:hypothetical protein